MKKPVFGFLFLLIFLAALLVRIIDLDLRPMHHDEANQAVKFGSLLENGEYRYDRADHHGPTLYYLSLPIIRLLTGAKFADTGESGLRLIPALFGLGILLLLLLLRDALSDRGVILCAILTAISPLMVFYSRFYIQETLLVFFTVGALTAGWRYCRNPCAGWAVLTGFFTGMMYATKETCLIIFAALLGALILTRITHKRIPLATQESLHPTAKPSIKGFHLLAALSTALCIAILFYSSFFKNPAGPVDSVLAFKTYFVRAGDSGFHIHPWYYYLKMLAFSKYGSGPAWSEGLVLILALIGSTVSIRGKVPGSMSPVFLRFVFFYTLLTTAIFSLIPYKTPWNMLPFYSGLIILACAGGLSILDWFKIQPAGKPLLPRGSNKGQVLRVGVRLLLLAGIVNLGLQSVRANFKYYADNRNPYVYAHTVNDFKRLVERIRNIAALHPDQYDMRIKVITNPYDTWPLPWYLRKFRRVGYWQDVTSAGPLASVPLIAASLDKAETIRPVLKNGFQAEYYGLRPEVLMVIYIRQDLWQAFMKTRII